MQNRDIGIQGIPKDVPEYVAAVCRSRLHRAVNDLLDETGLEKVKIVVGTLSPIEGNDGKNPSTIGNTGRSRASDDLPTEERARQYKSQKPLFDFEQLVVPDHVREDILSAVDVIRVESKVFDEWGLKKIEPFPRTALNFYGPPGTGKTLAAHAIAYSLGRPILVASYAQIESKFHGDGPKNVEALFYAASRDNALLFIDEADSLLSKRLTDATQGSERAANSMCSQLLICLEKFRGVVVFATNLVENYDKAFETRVRHIHFPMPDEKARREIWRRHLPPQLPLAPDVPLDVLPDDLAKVDDICGRDIKNAVIDAAVRAARQGKAYVALADLLEAVERIKRARIAVTRQENRKLKPAEEAKVREQLRATLSKREPETTGSCPSISSDLDA